MDGLRWQRFGFPTQPNAGLCVRDLWRHVRHVTHSQQPRTPTPPSTALKRCRVTTLFFLQCFGLEIGSLVPSLRLSGISHTLVTPPQLSLPPVKGHGVSGPAVGQEWRAGVFC